MECEDCRGSGKIVVYKNDATAAWPGGPMTGSWPGKFEELKKKTK